MSKRLDLLRLIAGRVKLRGFVELDGSMVLELFPHPVVPYHKEIDAVAKAILAGEPPPPVTPSQREQIDAWCAGLGFAAVEVIERNILRVSVDPAARVACCERCEVWEPERRPSPDHEPVIGYCPVFDKRTCFDHGDKCTAFKLKTQRP